MKKQIQEYARIAIISVMAVIFATMISHRELVKPEWLSDNSRRFVEKSLNEFCSDIASLQTCPNRNVIGKTRWLMNTKFDENNAPSKETVLETLKKYHWIDSGKQVHAVEIFCKDTFSASFTVTDNYVQFVEFGSGELICDQ